MILKLPMVVTPDLEVETKATKEVAATAAKAAMVAVKPAMAVKEAMAVVKAATAAATTLAEEIKVTEVAIEEVEMTIQRQFSLETSASTQVKVK